MKSLRPGPNIRETVPKSSQKSFQTLGNLWELFWKLLGILEERFSNIMPWLRPLSK